MSSTFPSQAFFLSRLLHQNCLSGGTLLPLSNHDQPVMPPHRIIKSTEALLRAGYSTSRPRKPLGRSFNPRSRPPRISPERTRPWAQSAKQSTQEGQPEKQSVSDALRDIKPEDNNLLTPVHVPENPNGVLNERHPSASILANSAIIIQRQLELMNIMIGFEQANKYVIMDPQGNHLGYMAEQDNSLGKSLKRQMFNTHRSFTTHVFDRSAREVLRVRMRHCTLQRLTG